MTNSKNMLKTNKNLSQFIFKDYIALGYEGDLKIFVPKKLKSDDNLSVVDLIGYNVELFKYDYVHNNVNTYYIDKTLNQYMERA